MKGLAIRGVLLLAMVVASGCSKRRSAGKDPSAAKPARCSNRQQCLARCERGVDRACERLTGMYLRGTAGKQSEVEAALLNKRLCERGRRYFCPTYAFVLAVGRGVAQDTTKARALFRDTCHFDPVACREYGSLFARGRGVERDIGLGILLLDLACRAKHAFACAELDELRGRRRRIN
ncbi:MAG: sel1 repeat family protein [Myxococcales bacterium]|nr:sel1 repeat family protein [Myxococcales bacterium]